MLKLLPSVSGMPHNFIYAASSTNEQIEIKRKTETETDEELARKGRVARLASLPVTAPDSDLCMSFWYHFTEKHTGTLNIKQRIEGLEVVAEEKREDNELLIRSVNGQMKSRWREGRVLIPSADTPYQVLMTTLWAGHPDSNMILTLFLYVHGRWSSRLKWILQNLVTSHWMI